MKQIVFGGAVGALLLMSGLRLHAQAVSYTGGILTQNFDGMGAGGTTTPAGWFVGWHNGFPPGTDGAVVRASGVTVNNGTIAPGGAIAGFNCGTNDPSGGADRSLGTGPTATSSPNGTNRFVEVRIQNDSGQTLRAIRVTYTGKEWRTSSSTTGQAFTNYLQFSSDGTNYVFMGLAFDFQSPVTEPGGLPLNGNLPDNSVADLGGVFALPAPLGPGALIHLRWLDVNDPSTDPVLAIDNVSFEGLANVPVVTISHGDFGYTFDVFAGMTDVPGTNNGSGTQAQFRSLHAVAADRQGNVYVADTGNHLIRKITPLGVVSTLAGQVGVTGTNNGTGTGAKFNAPEGICVDTNGNVFVAEIGGHTIRKITPNGLVTTVAGLGGASGSDNGTGSAARFNVPVTVEVDDEGFLYVGDYGNHLVRRISPAGEVTTLAGVTGVAGTRNGPVAVALFNHPHTCLPDNRGNVYVADLDNHAIRRISSNGVVSTFAGSPGNSGTNDGVGPFARFYHPWGLVFESTGNLLVTDRENDLLRRIAPDRTVKTIAGMVRVDGSANGRGTNASFTRLRGIALAPDGNLFIGDLGNQTVRIGRPDPTLRIARPTGPAILSWPAWATAFQLESSLAVRNAPWMSVTSPPVTVGASRFVTNALAGAAQFFRLRSP